jgi:hypothetical protein
MYVHPMSNIPPLLTTSEVAKSCGDVAVKTVTRWVESGQLAYAQKLGGLRGAYLFDPAEVARFKKSRERQVTS